MSHSVPTSVSYRIRRARRADVSFLPEVEAAAARLLVGHAPESVLSETTPITDFENATEAGLLWVATLDDRPVGFAQVKRLEQNAVHLDELDVHPTHGRRGLGRRLVTAVCDWAVDQGDSAVTLSTFRDVPWNMPFYASLGFEVLPAEQWTNALGAIVADERRRGLEITRRVIMRRQL